MMTILIAIICSIIIAISSLFVIVTSIRLIYRDQVNHMDIWIGFNRVKAKVIEWANIRRTKPIAFFATCPSCRCRQWAKVDYLYRAADGTKRNLRCKKCDIGKPKPGDWQRRGVDPYKSFSPKGTGWRSINSNATPSETDKPLNKD